MFSTPCYDFVESWFDKRLSLFTTSSAGNIGFNIFHTQNTSSLIFSMFGDINTMTARDVLIRPYFSFLYAKDV